ncbi:MAG: hypothetical protein R3244_03635 [Thermoanaerobaculia bacterium]|nr:hypothetical protein [Thermoanaerobaculia bacterium]
MTLARSGVSLHIGGSLDSLDLPAGNLGTEILPEGAALTTFSATRGIAGTSGTTTVQLELNGALVAGAAVSWTPADGDYSNKSVTGFEVFVDEGDRLSLRVTSAEVGGADVYVKVIG